MQVEIGSIGKFQVVSTLGSGAQSIILHIRRRADGKSYALKVVPLTGPEDHKFQEQAQHELRIAKMLDHPNLIKVYALETVRDWLFRPRKLHLLIEYVNGKTLDTVGRIPIPLLISIFVKIAEGLVHMHRRNIYHADLKPGNIMLNKSGDVKIIDFGLAWLRGESKGRIQGTPEYMAPEQVKHRTVNEKTDIYNFGATMYRLATLRLPPNNAAAGDLTLDSKTHLQMLIPVQQCNKEAPEELANLIHQCLAFNPVKRPERVSEIHGVLDHLEEKVGSPTPDLVEELDW
ncbi:MAG TPA: serine/threonine-protein kinase [Gemmataceae bacterium]|jgi:serine/threonine protein kinase|nr:serine/threonine-protein kinase [Gemmataceae bacterium]